MQPEILCKIFGRLCARDLGRVCTVSKEWFSVIQRVFVRRYTKLVLAQLPGPGAVVETHQFKEARGQSAQHGWLKSLERYQKSNYAAPDNTVSTKESMISKAHHEEVELAGRIADLGHKSHGTPVANALHSPTRGWGSTRGGTSFLFFLPYLDLPGGRRSLSTWTVPQDDPQQKAFYEEVLRPELRTYYQQMPKPKPQSTFVKVTQNTIVEAALRYPPLFRSHFFDQIVKNGILVDDPEIVYPLGWDTLFRQSVVSPLKHPLEVIKLLLPPEGWHFVYVDASPGTKNRGGGGGFVKVDSKGNVECFSVKIRNDSSFSSEGIVFWHSAKFVASLKDPSDPKVKKVKKVAFISDCLDLVEFLNGRGHIRESYYPMYRYLVAELSQFEEWRIDHCPREGLSLVDKIARLNSQGRERRDVDVVREFHPLTRDVKQLLDDFVRRIPVLRIEKMEAGLSAVEVLKKRRHAPRNQEVRYAGKVWNPPEALLKS